MSDVPLGMFLSGGLDSSALAALMARMADRPLHTFSVGLRRAGRQRARLRAPGRASAIGAHAPRRDRHAASEFFDALPRLVWHEDEPIALPSSVPLYFVSRLARAARQGRAHRRGHRRAVPRLQPVPRDGLERARSGASTGAVPPASGAPRAAPRSGAAACRRRCAATRGASFLALGAGRARALLRQLRGLPGRGCGAACCADGGRRERDPVRATGCAAYDEGAGASARPAAPRRPRRRICRRAADEAGPDEHGGVDREPRAVPRPRARRARGRAARRASSCAGCAPRRCCATPSRELVPARDPHAAQDGLPGAVRPLAARAAPGPLVEEFVLGRARAERGLFDPAALEAARGRASRAAPRDHGERLWLLVEPRALAAHLHRRRARAAAIMTAHEHPVGQGRRALAADERVAGSAASTRSRELSTRHERVACSRRTTPATTRDELRPQPRGLRARHLVAARRRQARQRRASPRRWRARGPRRCRWISGAGASRTLQRAAADRLAPGDVDLCVADFLSAVPNLPRRRPASRSSSSSTTSST